MGKGKAMFVTAMIMALLTAVIYCVWRFGKAGGFSIVMGLFAVYGYCHFASDLCRWMQMPEVKLLDKVGKHFN